VEPIVTIHEEGVILLEKWTQLVNLLHCFSIFTPILHLRRRRMKLLNLQGMDPPQFKAKVPHTHSLKIENGKKEV
jgi:hypothetical protein